MSYDYDIKDKINLIIVTLMIISIYLQKSTQITRISASPDIVSMIKNSEDNPKLIALLS